MATYQKVGGFQPDGTKIGDTADLLGLYGRTPIAQQTAPAVALSVDPTVSGCALLASVQSVAVSAGSLANAIRQDLIDIGVYT